MASSGTAIDAALETLAAFIATGVSGLTVLREWPYATQQLAYPSLTITSKNPKRMAVTPYLLSKTDPDVDLKVVANEVVAEWDDILQMDLWARDKDERRRVTDAIIALFNSQENGPTGAGDGLSLQVAGNFNEWCRYDIESARPVDDEAGAQRQERREMITVLVNLFEVRQRTYYAMTTIQVQTEAATENAPLTDDGVGTETTVVQ